MRLRGQRFAQNHDIKSFRPAALDTQPMPWTQRPLQLPAYSRGFHLITHEVLAALPELAAIEVGLLHVFLQHTSASLTINENADPDVPADLESSFSRLAPEGSCYRHTSEGPDDMPAHVKASLLGSSLTIPVADRSLCLGTWQGIYLCEHRRHGGRRRLILTLWGESEPKR
jgi:secondary thiamine-phosphate synthase enzyme